MLELSAVVGDVGVDGGGSGSVDIDLAAAQKIPLSLLVKTHHVHTTTELSEETSSSAPKPHGKKEGVHDAEDTLAVESIHLLEEAACCCWPLDGVAAGVIACCVVRECRGP